MSAELWLKLLSYCHVLFSEYISNYSIGVFERVFGGGGGGS